ncbi:MAG: ABC transporter substrate-binding protein [Cyanobacteria bacterium J06623_5]
MSRRIGRICPVWHRFWRFASLFFVTASLCIACNAQSENEVANNLPTLVVGNSPWPGFVAQFVAEEKGFYEEEGIAIDEKFLQVSTDVNTALAGDRIDVAWTGVPDMVVMANDDPSLRLIAVSDYSDGADGILAKNVAKPQDLVGKTIAWEELPLQALLLEAYLDGTDVALTDLDLKVMPAAEAATAFAAGQVDVAITFEPWLTTAVKEGGGEVVFTSANTNLIAGGLVGKTDVIESRREDLDAYFRALEKGFAFYEENTEEAIGIVANKLNLASEELPPILETVRLFRPSEHQSVVFNAEDSLNIMDSIDFAAEVGKEMEIVDSGVVPDTLFDASYTEDISAGK